MDGYVRTSSSISSNNNTWAWAGCFINRFHSSDESLRWFCENFVIQFHTASEFHIPNKARNTFRFHESLELSFALWYFAINKKIQIEWIQNLEWRGREPCFVELTVQDMKDPNRNWSGGEREKVCVWARSAVEGFKHHIITIFNHYSHHPNSS